MSHRGQLIASLIATTACGTAPEATQTPIAATPVIATTPPDAAPTPSSTCTTDTDCSVDQDRCVAIPGSSTGSCVCFDNHCALRPSAERISKQPCEDSSDCDVDLASGQCEPGIAPDDEYQVRYAGPTCRCNEADHRCHLNWFDPVACNTDDDCWFDDKPVLHAIARSAKHKGRKFRACVDGERVPACVESRCTIRAAAC